MLEEFLQTDQNWQDFSSRNRVTLNSLAQFDLAGYRELAGLTGLEDYYTPTGLQGQAVIDQKIRSKIYRLWLDQRTVEKAVAKTTARVTPGRVKRGE